MKRRSFLAGAGGLALASLVPATLGFAQSGSGRLTIGTAIEPDSIDFAKSRGNTSLPTTINF